MGAKAPKFKGFLMLFNFLEFLGIEHKEKAKSVTISNKETQEIEIINEIIECEQIYKIEEKEIIKNDKKIIKQIIEIQPLGNGKAIKVVRSQTMER